MIETPIRFGEVAFRGWHTRVPRRYVLLRGHRAQLLVHGSRPWFDVTAVQADSWFDLVRRGV